MHRYLIIPVHPQHEGKMESCDGEKLYHAACNGNEAEVRELLDMGVKWDAYKNIVSLSRNPLPDSNNVIVRGPATSSVTVG